MKHKEPTYYLGTISKIMSALIFGAMFLMLPTRLEATHIVGGEITYRCLGGDMYEVKVAVYRDCINGSALAVFDDPAAVGIFDVNNNLQIHLGSLGQLLIPFNADDTLSLATDCVEGMGGICVQQTFYIDTIQLPYLPGGYQLVYQRCCRNETLVNIVEPLETGTSMVTTISDQALRECNSAPEFREWPPIFICVNEEIAYDHSATDVDGDSLVYRLCTPLMGATRQNPVPHPPSFPPYEEVIWAPGYAVDNMLGGAALTIDQNGQLTGTPNSLGQFLVGICVEEYRNGTLMSMTRRDFEYNVVDCDGLVFTNYTLESEVICADVVDVVITDQSMGVDPGASWSYTVTKENGDELTFDEQNPSFRIQGTSSIQVTQIVQATADCTTRKTRTFKFDTESTGINDGDTITICSGSSVQLNRNPSDRFTYRWTPERYLDDPTNPNPISTPEESITYTVEIFDRELECAIEKTVHVQVVLIFNRMADFTVSKDCRSTTLQFTNTSLGDEGVFLWDFGDPNNPDASSTEENPTYTYSEPGTYVVSLSLPGDDCNSIRTERLAVAGDDFEDFNRNLDVCGPSLVVIDHGLNPDYLFTWDPNPYFDDLSNPLPDVFLDSAAQFSVTVVDPLNADCVINGTVSVAVGDQLILPEIKDSVYSCDGIDVELNAGGDPDLIYLWAPAELLEDRHAANPVVSVSETTTFTAMVTDPNDPDCTVRLNTTVLLGLNDGGFKDGDSLVVCSGSTLFINSGANPDLNYQWAPADFLDDPSLPNPIAAPEETITYTATISDDDGSCSISKSITLVVVDSDVLLDFGIEKECDSRTLMFINRSVNATSFSWDFGDPSNPNFVTTEENPTYTYPRGGTYEVQLSSSSDPNCTAYHAQRIAVTGEDFVDFADTIRTCDVFNIALNPDLNPFYIYAWQADDAIADTTEANPIVRLKTDRTFYVTVTDPLNDTCQIEGSVFVVVDTSLVAGLQETIAACEGGTVQLNPNGNPDAMYIWSPAELLDDATLANPSTTVNSTTVFHVVITDPNDPTCLANVEVTVLVGDSADIVTSQPVDMACPGDIVTLSGRVELFDSLVWIAPSGMIVGRGGTISFPIAEDGVYRAVGYKDDCSFFDSFRLSMRTLIFTLDPEMAGCAGDPVQISVTSNSDFLFDSVLWLPSESIAIGQGSETVVVRPDSSTTYFAMMFFSDGCMAMDSVLVPVSDIDDRFSAIADPDTIFFGEQTTLIATDEPGASYQWGPTDDLQTPNSSSTVAIPPFSGTYTVSITDASGCMTEQQVQVEVIMVNCDRPDIFLPNAFTPNGDGQNDVLFVRGLYIEEVDLIIVNRWGQKVFETNSQSNGWDGTFNGEALAPDVYGYYLRVDCIGGGRHIEKGNITLLR